MTSAGGPKHATVITTASGRTFTAGITTGSMSSVSTGGGHGVKGGGGHDGGAKVKPGK